MSIGRSLGRCLSEVVAGAGHFVMGGSHLQSAQAKDGRQLQLLPAFQT